MFIAVTRLSGVVANSFRVADVDPVFVVGHGRLS